MKPNFFYYQKDADKFSFYNELLKKSATAQKQALIVVPEIQDINFFIKALKIKPTIIHSQLKPSIFFKNWLESRKSPLIIGTKQAVFCPFGNLGLIILDQANSKFHKNYDQNPRFHAKDIAIYLAEKHDSRLYFSDYYLGVENYFYLKNKQYDLIEPESKRNKLKIEIIDLNKERAGSNYSPISYSLEQNIKNRKKIFIFVNKKGDAGFLKCKDCAFVFRCPDCNHLLAKYSRLICLNCSYKQELPSRCPNCHGANIASIGTTIESLKKEISKIFPGEEIATVQKGKTSNQKPKIIIGTEFAFKKLNFSKFDAFAIASIDQYFSSPAFNSGEKIYHLVSRMINICLNNRIDQLLIQTNFPENPIFEAIIKNDFAKFAEKELKSRKEFNYPPYNKILRLIFKTKENKEEFKNFLEKNGLEPEETIKGNLILRVPKNFYFTEDIIKNMPDNCLVDINSDEII